MSKVTSLAARSLLATGLLAGAALSASAQGLLGQGGFPSSAAPTTVTTPTPITVSAGARSPENLRGWTLGYDAQLLDLGRRQLARRIRAAVRGLSREEKATFLRGLGEGHARALLDQAGAWRVASPAEDDGLGCVVSGPDACLLPARLEVGADGDLNPAARAYNLAAWRRFEAERTGRPYRAPRVRGRPTRDAAVAVLEGELHGQLTAQSFPVPTTLP